MAISTPHDALFKAIFGMAVHASALLRAALPPSLADWIDWDALEMVSGSVVDELLVQRHGDLLFRVRTGDGSELLLLLMVEHQSRSEPRMPLRFLGYGTRAWETSMRTGTHSALPVIIPVVVSHDPSGWKASPRFQDMFGGAAEDARVRAYVPRFRHVVVDLARDPTVIRRLRGSPVARLTLLVLRDARSGALGEAMLAAFDAWSEIERSGADEEIAVVVRYTLEVADVSEHPRILEIAERVGPRTKEKAMTTIAEHLRAEGRAEGRVEGLRRALLLQAEARFGPVDPGTAARVVAADSATLERWLGRVVTARELREVVGDSSLDQ